MSEEKRKEKHKPRKVTIIALFTSIVAFACGLVGLPLILRMLIFPDRTWFIDEITILYFIFVAMYPMFLLIPLAAISLVLSIITFFIEQDKRSRILPLAIVMVLILLYAACYAYLWFTTDLL